ncbi:MAG: glycosyltransferase family 4 protein [Sphaerochaetaceae bacterium]|nr:glycosyltransferase family 4 protein [Sphaerochaetaceae bacterium]
MRILIISNLYPPHVLGGYEILCGQVVGHLTARGHEVHVLTSDFRDGTSGEDVTRSLKVYQDFEKSASFMRTARMRTARHNWKETMKLLREREFDVAFIWSLLRLTPASAHAVQRFGLPTVYTFNDENIMSFSYHRFSPSLKQAVHSLLDRLFPLTTLRGLDFSRTTCISRILKRNLLARGLPVDTSRVIYQGIPVETFPLKDEPGVMKRPARILYVGQLHPYKGVHTIIEALTIMADREHAVPCSLTIVGKGTEEYTQSLKEKAFRAPFDVEFTGLIAHDELPAMYRQMDIFIFPSIWEEPFGLTHLEAMASGLPVISTVNGGQGEFLIEGENALTFPPDDPVSLCEQLERLTGDEELYAGLCERGRKTAEEHFSFERYVTDLEELLAESSAN